METYTEKTKKSASLLKKINLFIFFTMQIFLIEACEYKLTEQDSMMNDQIRNMHAEQILQDEGTSAESINKEFNGDPKFNRYIAAFIKRSNRSLNADQFTNSLFTISREHSYDPVFLLAVMKTESSFNQFAIGSVGEVGLMQIRPETAEWVCLKNKIAWRGANALKDPEYNMLIGSYYFQYLKLALKSKSIKYITAYNMGLSKMNRMADQMTEHQYFERVVKNYLSIYSELKRIKSRKTV
ncbi:MAG: lytic transglycosylase domain-containing protein [Bdellovibrionaceae bacterium]|nr:lytic transglycosylase domain-containing protein [Pseudobdellovibrionaceae bacterium]